MSQAPQTEPVDRIDLALLRALREDGRASVAALADHVKVSRSSAYSRLERLRSIGVVEGFSPRVNSARMGLGVSAVILVKVNQPARFTLPSVLNEIEHIEYCAFVSGEYDLIVIARAKDVATLRDNVVWKLESEPSVLSTNTTLIMDEIINRPYVLP